MAMKLLEKDIHEKQDTIVSLRRQLEDIKQINLEMYNKLQVYNFDSTHPQKTSTISIFCLNCLYVYLILSEYRAGVSIYFVRFRFSFWFIVFN